MSTGRLMPTFTSSAHHRIALKSSWDQPASRRARGPAKAAALRVCWLIRDGLNTPSANEALARAQAVRFRVVDDSRRVAQPWRDPPGSVLADGLYIEVFMAIAARPRDWLRPGEPWFRTGGYCCTVPASSTAMVAMVGGAQGCARLTKQSGKLVMPERDGLARTETAWNPDTLPLAIAGRLARRYRRRA